MTASPWQLRSAKIKTYLQDGNPRALLKETAEYIRWKCGLYEEPPEEAPVPAPIRMPSEEEFWDETDSTLGRAVTWMAPCDGALGAWAQEELLDGQHLIYVVPELMGDDANRSPKYAMVLGCGDMRTEHSLLIYPDLQFDRIDAYDISTKSMERAAEFTQQRGLKVDYNIGDANTMAFPTNKYSLILCFFAYHHFREVDRVAEKIGQALTENGIFITIDYVGPPRLQYSEEQLYWARHLLATLPERYRSELSGPIRTEIHPIPLDMISPDEAPCSDQILEAMDRHLDVVHQYNFAGLLYPLLEGIGGNFADTPEDRELVRFFFDLDKLLVSSKQIPPNYTMTVARKRQGF